MSLSHQQQIEAMLRAAMRGERVVLTAPTFRDAQTTYEIAKKVAERLDAEKKPRA